MEESPTTKDLARGYPEQAREITKEGYGEWHILNPDKHRPHGHPCLSPASEVREAIKRIMEGGEAAFNLRREKYGF